MEKIGCPSFAFQFVSLKETKKLSVKKASLTKDISVKIMKEIKIDLILCIE